MDLEVTGPVFSWRGPAPYHFVEVPDQQSADIEAVAAAVSYGWGVIPVEAQVGSTSFTTSLFPKSGLYLVPLKDRVRKAEGISLGDVVTIRLTLAPRR